MFQDIEKPLSLMEVARSNRDGDELRQLPPDTRVLAILVHLTPSAYLCVQTYIEKVSLRQVNAEGLKLL